MGTGNGGDAFHGEGCLVFPGSRRMPCLTEPWKNDVSICWCIPFNPWIFSLEPVGGMSSTGFCSGGQKDPGEEHDFL